MNVRTTESRSELDPGVTLIEVSVPRPIAPPSPAIDALTRTGRRLKAMPFVRTAAYTAAYYDEIAAEMARHWRYIRAVAAAVNVREFDVVHVHHGKQAYALRKLYRTPYVYTNHWAFAPGDAGFHANVERIVMREARVAIGLGQYAHAFSPTPNVGVIPHGIDCDEWPRMEHGVARTALGLNEDDFLLVFVGGVVPLKGVDVLVEAVRQVVPEIEKVKLYIIGSLQHDKSFVRSLMDRAAGLPVIFAGPVAHRSAQHRRFLAAADLFVLPSRFEAQGLAALEALVMGTPVVGSDVGGLRDMVTAEVGCLVPPGDVMALTESLLRLYRDKSMLERLRQRCRSYVEEKYGWDSVARRYVDAFRRAA